MGKGANRSRRLFSGRLGIATLLLLSVGLSACTTDSGDDPTQPVDTTTGATNTETTAAPANGELTLADIPADYQQYYEGYEYFSSLFPDPYTDWTPPEAPWKFCLNDSYTGNDWRQGNLVELERQVALYQEAGLATGPLVVTDSNNEITMQISQFSNLVDEGCNVIFSIPGSPTAMCEVFERAYNQNVLVITDESPTNCEYSINVSWNGYWAQYTGGKAVLDALGGKGNVINIAGIPGVPLAVAEEYAIVDLMKEYPDVNHLGTVAGDWNPATTATEMTRFLATHPQQIDGIIEAGGEAVAAQEAMVDAGREMAVVNSIDGSKAFMAFWKQNPNLQAIATNQSPASAAYEAFLVAVRKLAGQNLVVNTVFYPVPVVTNANFDDYYDESYTTTSSGFPTPPDGVAVEDEFFDGLFSGGGEVQLMPAHPVPES